MAEANNRLLRRKVAALQQELIGVGQSVIGENQSHGFEVEGYDHSSVFSPGEHSQPSINATDTFISDPSPNDSSFISNGEDDSLINDASPAAHEQFQHMEENSLPLEEPPITSDDFDWDESLVSMTPELEVSSNGVDAAEFVDGMASLSIGERDVGYLGVASGAALLRNILRPDERQRGSFSEGSGTIRHRRTSSMLLPQPQNLSHVMDAMVDGYFRSYHLAYPIIHEPSFKAQYSGVIQAPEGSGWKSLVYIVAAIGAFCTATEPSVVDVSLFQMAKSHLSIDNLETGNVTLVQALSLMSNYLQKRNKPNSGYNYAGLALRIASSLGLHKEFVGWKIKPLHMEIRRRVFWTLFVFDVGASITFSRPLGWPTAEIQVKLPLNVNDRVGSEKPIPCLYCVLILN